MAPSKGEHFSFVMPSLARPTQRIIMSMPNSTSKASLKGQTVVVTGATRGIGRGLAVGLAEQQAHVIVTGRTKEGPDSLEETEKAVRQAGGTCDTYVVDHSNDSQQTQFFSDLSSDLQSTGRTLDIFVNNAYSAVSFVSEHAVKGTPFWERTTVPEGNKFPGAVWDVVNGVGLRSIYVSSILATRMMLKFGTGGVIINITSIGGTVSIFDPAYSIGKAAIDRMTFEFAKGGPQNVQYIAFCPGTVATKDIVGLRSSAKIKASRRPHRVPDLPFWNMETPLFVGRCMSALLMDKEMVQKNNGHVVLVANVGEKFQIEDENDFRPLSIASLRCILLTLFPYLRTSSLRFLFPRKPIFHWAPLLKSVSGTIEYY